MKSKDKMVFLEQCRILYNVRRFTPFKIRTFKSHILSFVNCGNPHETLKSLLEDGVFIEKNEYYVLDNMVDEFNAFWKRRLGYCRLDGKMFHLSNFTDYIGEKKQCSMCQCTLPLRFFKNLKYKTICVNCWPVFATANGLCKY